MSFEPWFRENFDHRVTVIQSHKGFMNEKGEEEFALGDKCKGNQNILEKNRSYLSESLKMPLIFTAQVHGHKVAHVSDKLANIPVADGLVSEDFGCALVILTADCLPVALFGDQSIGLAHAGWRGLASGILERTIEQMIDEPNEISAWLGPCIGQNSFEVGFDVFRAFENKNQDFIKYFVNIGSGSWLCDLRGLAIAILKLRKVKAIQSINAPNCTYSDSSFWYSFRRDKTSKRMGTCIYKNNK